MELAEFGGTGRRLVPCGLAARQHVADLAAVGASKSSALLDLLLFGRQRSLAW